MSLPSINPTKTKSWQLLQKHFNEIKNSNRHQIFSEDKHRFKHFYLKWQDFYLDYSKNLITDKTLELLLSLADEVKLKQAIDQQFSGDKINRTEDRAVLHTALRDFDGMKTEVQSVLQKIKAFSETIIGGSHKGYTGKSITDVVNIGIGGSHLGPEMVVDALKFYGNHLKLHFIANVDGDDVAETLKDLNPETTVFIVVSKSFKTQETLANATVVKNWFLKRATKSDVQKHFVAISVNIKAAEEFGIAGDNIFPMEEWVGGRFSLWGSVGLSICCAIGYAHFEELLKGAFEMDKHFKNTEFSENIPVVMALISIWYNNFFNVETEGIAPYSQYLNFLVPYLQQAVMESNGKSVDRNGEKIQYQTGTIVWGNVGTNSQHAYFQLLHQGTKLIPTDFIGFAESLHSNRENHNMLMANFFAQTEALWEGTNHQAPDNAFKVFDGYKPTNTLLIKKLTPHTLGSLISIYEHKLFVQGIIWNIFSYDQWGVELGKSVAEETLKAIEENDPNIMENPSTQNLLREFIKMKTL